MALEGMALGGFNMGAVDAPTKMDISLDDMIKRVSAHSPGAPRIVLPRAEKQTSHHFNN